MRPKTIQHALRVSLLAGTCLALFFTASTRISGSGSLTLIATSTVAKPGDNVIGRAVAFGNGGLYYAAQWRPTSPADDMEALAGKLPAPLTNGAAPTWQRQWPDGDATFSNTGCQNFSPLGNGPDQFVAIAVAADGVYFGGDSYRQTVDGNGCKENKEIVAKFNLDGSAGVADVAGAVALWRQRFGTTYGYDGTEIFQSLIASVESGTTYIYGGGFAQLGTGNGRGIRKYDTNGNTIWEYAATNGYEYRALAVLGSFVYAAGQNGSSVPQIVRFGTAGPAPVAPLYTSTVDAPYTSGVYTSLAVLNNTIYAAGYLASTAPSEAQAYLLDAWDTTTGTRVIHRVWSSDPTKSNNQQLTGIVAVGSRLFAVGWTRDTDNPATAHNMGGSTTAVFTDSAAYHGFSDGVIFEVSPPDGSLIATTGYGTGDGLDQAFTGATTDGTDLYVIGAERNASAIYRAMVLRYSSSVTTSLVSVSGLGVTAK